MEIAARPNLREDRTGPQFWADEAIWGHRLHDEQTPWLAVLEFLGVFQAENAKGRPFAESRLNTLSYKPQQQLRLRNLLFNNPHVVTVRAELNNDDDRWRAWLERMANSAGGIEDTDFSYLRKHFSSFQDLATAIGFLQSSAIEGASNKRWTSKFVFPFGGNALYEDVNVSAANGVTNDRRFFARTGEILYLMLCRSRRVDDLRKLVTARLLVGEGPYDKLVGVLQGPPEEARQERGGSYLPLERHPTFDRLAEDWISLLRCQVPTYDVIPHLVTMTGLNLVLYQLERSREVLGWPQPVSLVWEIIGPKRTKVRELSEKSFQGNQIIPGQALEHYIRSITQKPGWADALVADHPRQAAAELLEKHFGWPTEEDLDDLQHSPEQMVDVLVERARIRHRQHVGRFHGAWSRFIGLSSRRSSRSTRYAPTDRLLKTLVVSAVERRMELKDFLVLLWERYGIIIGDQQAVELTERGAADHEDFSDNARRLEDRLASLGLLERFSDSCAYVINPFEKIS
jgi:hypothetical protein